MEAVGAAAGVAGLASLAIQLGETAIKIRRLYSSVRDAPAKLEDLALELQTMALHLRQLERYRLSDQSWGYSEDAYLLDLIVQRCTGSVRKIADVADKLEARIARSRLLGRLYISFKDTDIAEMWQTIEREKSSLALVYQVHASVTIQAKLDEQQCKQDEQQHLLAVIANVTSQHASDLQNIQQALLASHQSTPSVSSQPTNQAQAALTALNTPSPNANTAEKVVRRPTHVDSRGKQRQRRSLKLHLWFSNSIWQLSYQRMQNSWAFSLQSWNIIPTDSEVFEMCRRGSIAGVKSLILAGKASFYDTDQEGRTMADIAAGEQFISVKLLIFLLDNCSSLKDGANLKWSLRSRTLYDTLEFSVLPPQLYSLAGVPDLDIDEIISPKPALTNMWPNSLSPDFVTYRFPSRKELSQVPLQSRFTVAMLTHDLFFQGPHEFLRLCCLEDVTTELAHITLPDGRTALHFACKSLAWGSSLGFSWGLWKRFAKKLIQRGAALHALSSGKTPFMVLLEKIGNPRYLDTAASRWAAMLRETGVDLMQYGRKEASLMDCASEYWISRSENRYAFRYGPEAGDWMVEERIHIEVFRLSQLPGAFPVTVPDTIIWTPSRQEELEGKWNFLRTHAIKSCGLSARGARNTSLDEERENDLLELFQGVVPSYDDARSPQYPSRLPRSSWVVDGRRSRSAHAYSQTFVKPLGIDERKESSSRLSMHACWRNGHRFMAEDRFLSSEEHDSSDEGRLCSGWHQPLGLEDCRRIAWDLRMERLAAQP